MFFILRSGQQKPQAGQAPGQKESFVDDGVRGEQADHPPPGYEADGVGQKGGPEQQVP